MPQAGFGDDLLFSSSETALKRSLQGMWALLPSFCF